jgi:DNA primase
LLLCPFHQEKTPSCVISPEKNLYHCFGCGAAGSVVDWMMKTEGFSLPKALLGQVVSWYHQNLLNSPDALAWLEKRGLNHPELVSHFRPGRTAW